MAIPRRLISTGAPVVVPAEGLTPRGAAPTDQGRAGAGGQSLTGPFHTCGIVTKCALAAAADGSDEAEEVAPG